MSVKPSVQLALDDLKAAQLAMIAAVEKAYPVGTLLIAKLGGHQVEVEVTSHNQCYWCNPGEIWGTNLKTGKNRYFMPSSIVEAVPHD